MELPASLYSSSQVRALDRHAIEHLGIPGYTLMERAAHAAVRVLLRRYPATLRLAVVCGGGNNGGDGYVLARLARAASLQVEVMTAVPPDRLQGDARRAFADWLSVGGAVRAFDAASLRAAPLIVDALFGTGLTQPLRDESRAVVQAINEARRPVLALDVPSGLCSDTGQVLGAAVQADATVTFVGLKQGLVLGLGPRLVGELYCDTLDLVPPAEAQFAPTMRRLTAADLRATLHPRARDAHKGRFGSVLVVGGGVGMPGAAALAARAALRVGAGKVRVACDPANVAPIVAHTAEVMATGIVDEADLDAALSQADTVLLGPGLGQDAWANACWRRALGACRERDLPLVLDADALNLLAANPEESVPKRCVLTPHPGEAARLLGDSGEAVQADRLNALDQLVTRFGVTVLKGACTLVGAPGAVPAVCTDGNPGMASAGMGDVLAGALAGLLAQIREVAGAASLAVLAHARAGDAAARAGGERGLLASDVLEGLRGQVNPC